MRRGFITGLICGSLIGLTFLALISIIDLAPAETPPMVQTNPQEMPQPMVDASSITAATPTQDIRPSVQVSKTKVTGDLGDPVVLPDENKVAVAPNLLSGTVASSAPAGLEMPEPSAAPMLPQLADATSQPQFREVAVLNTLKRDGLPLPQFLAAEPNPTVAQPVSPPAEADLTVEPEADAPETPPSPMEEVAATIPELVPQDQNFEFVPAIDAFAKRVALDPENPIVSFVLLDDPKVDLNTEVLSALPIPVTVAVNASSSDAAKRAAALDAAGLEVAVTGDLPKGASTGNTSDAFFAYVNAVPTAVAVVGGQGLGLRGSAARLDTLRSDFLETGHGYVAFSQSADSNLRRARSAGVPAAYVFRDLDADGQNAKIIRRFIDQAAFKARTQGPVILMLRMREESILALFSWGQKDRSRTLNITPLSAALLGNF